jgi:hypothetical protein
MTLGSGGGTTNPKLNDHMSSDEDNLSESDVFKENPNKFTQLLGLPKISIETIYQGYKEKDANVL